MCDTTPFQPSRAFTLVVCLIAFLAGVFAAGTSRQVLDTTLRLERIIYECQPDRFFVFPPSGKEV